MRLIHTAAFIAPRSFDAPRTVDELARLLVGFGLHQEACLEQLRTNFPDAHAEGALAAALRWKADRDSNE